MNGLKFGTVEYFKHRLTEDREFRRHTFVGIMKSILEQEGTSESQILQEARNLMQAYEESK